MSYITNFYNAKRAVKYLGGTQQDAAIRDAIVKLDELNKSILKTEGELKMYLEYTTDIKELIKARPDVVPDTIYKSRKRVEAKLERVFYEALPDEVMKGDEDALAFIAYMYDKLHVMGDLEGSLIFGDVLELGLELVTKPKAKKITAGTFIDYAPELNFLKQYVQMNYADKLSQLDTDRLGQLLHTLKDPTYNPELYKLATTYLVRGVHNE